MIRRPPRSTLSSSSAASDVYKRQVSTQSTGQAAARVRCCFLVSVVCGFEMQVSEHDRLALDLQDARHGGSEKVYRALRGAWDASWQWKQNLGSLDIVLVGQIMAETMGRDEKIRQGLVPDTPTSLTKEEGWFRQRSDVQLESEVVKDILMLCILGLTAIMGEEVRQHTDDTYSIISMIRVGPPCSREEYRNWSETDIKQFERLLTEDRKYFKKPQDIQTFLDALAYNLGSELGLDPQDIVFKSVRYNRIDNDGSYLIPFETEYPGQEAKVMTKAEELMARWDTIQNSTDHLDKLANDPILLKVLGLDGSDGGSKSKSDGWKRHVSKAALPIKRVEPDYTFVDPPATEKVARNLDLVCEVAKTYHDNEGIQKSVVSLIRWLAGWARNHEVVMKELRDKGAVELVETAATRHGLHDLQVDARNALLVLKCQCPMANQCKCQPPIVYKSDARLKNIRLCTFDSDISGAILETQAEGEPCYSLFGQPVKDKEALLLHPKQVSKLLSTRTAQGLMPFQPLKPSFSAENKSYQVSVGSSVVAVALIPTSFGSDVKSILVEGSAVQSAQTSQLIPLHTTDSDTPLRVTVLVTAQDMVCLLYTSPSPRDS
eukprot:TRINITY_DN8471_c0_g1_i2.p1 TRINITY_DN8471_c0_g1~~TRINITY_DN8471_c0_g1_i2.p1  ORF type:complete len:603 (+),score=146.52 TRINITY_DN8471_c0_g1_i2:106-1914(+)